MPPVNEKIKQVAEKWNNIIKKELSNSIDESELSSLSAWVFDCYESFEEIYNDHLEKIRTASSDDHDLIHDCVVDIYWQLDHIRNHINASEKAFSRLIKKLAKEESY